ncbi:hypothetical protein BDW67DRAFT_163010 [Aspergillus spinulosporus]
MAAAFTNMTAEEMARTPAGVPPPGVVLNLTDPPSIGHLLIIIGSCAMSVMVFAAGLRFYTRLMIQRAFRPDDWTALVGVLGTCAYFGFCVYAARNGYGTHMYNLSVARILGDGFIIAGFLTNWTTTVVWAFIKTTFLLMYLHIFRPLALQRFAIYLGLVVNWTFYTIILIVTLYFTSPAPGQTWAESFLSPRYTKIDEWMMPIAAGSLVLDVYILLLPIASVWRLQMSTRKKLGVLAVFATGFAACIASSLSIYYKHSLYHHSDDFSYYTLPVLIMCIMEMCVGITASCMPSMALLFRSENHPLSRLFMSARSLLGSGSDMSRGHRTTRFSRALKPWDLESPKKRPYLNMSLDSYNVDPDSSAIKTQIHSSGEDRTVLENGIQQRHDLVQEVEMQSVHSKTGLVPATSRRPAEP